MLRAKLFTAVAECRIDLSFASCITDEKRNLSSKISF